MSARCSSKRPMAPEKVKASRSPNSAKSAFSIVALGSSPVRALKRRPASSRRSIPKKSGMERNGEKIMGDPCKEATPLGIRIEFPSFADGVPDLSLFGLFGQLGPSIEGRNAAHY